jgi:ParB/RepB/Spo0J family partition protein
MAVATKRKKKPAEDYRDWPIVAAIDSQIEGCELPAGKYPVVEVFSGQIGIPDRNGDREYLNNGEFTLVAGADLVAAIKAGQEPGVPLHVKVTRELCEQLAADAGNNGHDCVADLLSGKSLRGAAERPATSGDKSPHSKAAEHPAKSGDKSPHSKREIVDLPLAKIHRHPANRQVKESTCKGLAADLRRRGLLSPIQVRRPGPAWKLPEGHYQIVFGERRTIAARLAGWDTIVAEVVELIDAEVQEAIAAENGQREQLNDIERARRLAELCKPVAQGGGGLTQTQAAGVLGIDQSTASTLLGLLQLPQVWQDLVIAGAMPGSHLRPLVKYADSPKLLQLFMEDYQTASDSKYPDEQAAWATRAAIEDTVHNLLVDRSRPLSKADCLADEGQWSLPRFEIGDAELQSLDVVEIPAEKGKGTIKRALAVETFQKLQHEKDESRFSGKTIASKKPASNGKAAMTSPAEIRKQQAEQEKELKERLRRPEGLTEQGLRWAMAERIREILIQHPNGNAVTHLVGQVLLDATRERGGSWNLDTCAWRHLVWRLVGLDRLNPAKDRLGNAAGFRNHEWYGNRTREVLAEIYQPEADCFRHFAYLGRLLLFPSDDRITNKPRLCAWGEWPDRWPAIDLKILKGLADDLEVDLDKTWEAARQTGPARRWFELVIATHNTRHLRESLCQELCVDVAGAARLDEMAPAIVAAHAARGLALPRSLRK